MTSDERAGSSVSYSVSRSAVFTFFVGDRFYGVVTAYVNGPQSASYDFTSSLATQVFRVLAPRLDDALGMSRSRSTRSRRSPQRPT